MAIARLVYCPAQLFSGTHVGTERKTERRYLRLAVWAEYDAIRQFLVTRPSLYILRLARVRIILRHCLSLLQVSFLALSTAQMWQR